MELSQSQSEPEYSNRLSELGNLRQSGRLDLALDLCLKELSAQPNAPTWLMESALCYLSGQQIAQAIEFSERAVTLAPSIAIFHAHLGMIRTVAGMRPAAVDAYRKALTLDPELAEAHLKLGQLLLSLGQREEAIECFEAAVRLRPDLAEAEVSWAEALIELGREEEAEEHLKPIESGDPSLILAQGIRLQVLGRFQVAEQCFRQVLAASPRSAASFYWIARGRKMTDADRPLIEQMAALARDQRLPIPEKIYLQYGLGKAREDLSEYRQAMNHYDEANGLTAIYRNVRLDRNGLIQYNDWRIRAFQRDPIEHFQTFGESSEKPLFVIGMIRSGTTLVEQMLSNHPDIGACGEMLYWNEQQERVNSAIANGTIDGNLVKSVAKEYLSLLEQVSPGTRRAIDKMPLNFFLLGPIHLVLPNARFIHVKRNPADTCFSIYTTYFESSPNFANNQDNIVFYYQEYERLMAHWRTVLPGDRFIEVSYEDLVSNPDKEMKRLVDFVGLEWNEACLHPELNQRAVRTPSAWQVRQPMYQTSRERWRHFQPWLDAIKKLGN
jgi:tetratricopeptide (TPR) repeat protein